MAKAEITTPQGLKVKLEGTPSEITELVRQLESKGRPERQGGVSRRRGAESGRVLIGDLILSLIDGGFFKKPQGLANIKAALEETGHHYPVTTLSSVMLRQVRRKNLRRIREQKNWKYVA